MTAKEITEIALARGLIEPRGKTPAVTMKARLYGLPPGSCIEREYIAGEQRAKRGSVRWTYIPGRAEADSSLVVRHRR